MILAGDVGGTSTRLALLELRNGRLASVVDEHYRSREHDSLEAVLRVFLDRHPAQIARAAFGIAGPVRNGRCDATNLPWVVESQRLKQVLGIPAAGLINDLEATALGIGLLDAHGLCLIHEGARDAGGNMAVIAAGTGLGEAGMYWDGSRHHPFASEGGHGDFAPRTEIEAELWAYLRPRFQHVSWERVLSGPGLVNLYGFLRDTGKGEEPAWLQQALRDGDPPAVITEAALADRSALCVQALDLFVSLYGAEAGNLALKTMASGGVYLGGGIAPKILPRLQTKRFLDAFSAKGRMQPLLERIPIRVILNEETALMGAARFAAAMETGEVRR
jgi:glucokinase